MACLGPWEGRQGKWKRPAGLTSFPHLGHGVTSHFFPRMHKATDEMIFFVFLSFLMVGKTTETVTNFFLKESVYKTPRECLCQWNPCLPLMVTLAVVSVGLSPTTAL